jgi:hypothetical protein
VFFRIIRITTITFILVSIFSYTNLHPTQAQKGSQLMRSISYTYRQVNQPGSDCLSAIAPSFTPVRTATGGYTGEGSAWGSAVFDAFNAMSGIVGGQLKRFSGSIPHRGILLQTDDQPVIFTDPETGDTLVVDEQGHAVITHENGTDRSEFDVFLNYFGEPVLNLQGEDGTVQRMSIDGYSAEISPEGDHCILCDLLETYELELDEDGFWTFVDEDGYIVWLEEDEDGTIYTSDSDGLEAFYYEDGSYEVYDENDELIESGELENLTLEERAEEFGIDPEDMEDFYILAWENSDFESIPEAELVPSEIMDDVLEDEDSFDDSTNGQALDEADSIESSSDSMDEDAPDTENGDSAPDQSDAEESADS